MGEVYQAKDRKLGRDMAIKVLPDELAGDPDRVAQFQREDKVQFEDQELSSVGCAYCKPTLKDS